jgi:hypothetical protein
MYVFFPLVFAAVFDSTVEEVCSIADSSGFFFLLLV